MIAADLKLGYSSLPSCQRANQAACQPSRRHGDHFASHFAQPISATGRNVERSRLMRQDASMATMNGFGQEYPGAGAARSLLGTVLKRYGPRDFAVQLWDGEQWPAQAPHRPRFHLILRSPSVVRGLFSQPDSLSFGEAFVYDQLDIKGSLLDIFTPATPILM
jgi:hypothetical protein